MLAQPKSPAPPQRLGPPQQADQREVEIASAKFTTREQKAAGTKRRKDARPQVVARWQQLRSGQQASDRYCGLRHRLRSMPHHHYQQRLLLLARKIAVRFCTEFFDSLAFLPSVEFDIVGHRRPRHREGGTTPCHRTQSTHNRIALWTKALALPSDGRVVQP